MTGRELHARWLTYRGGDDEWPVLQAETRAAWDLLALDLTADLQTARNNGVIECSEAMQDAWERREARRCPSTT